MPDYLVQYLNCNEDIIFERWDYDELPGCVFVLKKLREQKELYNPGACCNEENYMNFLKGVKNIYCNTLNKIVIE